MKPGDFFKRPSETGREFEVVMHHAVDSADCQRELKEKGIEVRDNAVLGHFVIHLEKPGEDWPKVWDVVMGELFDEDTPPPRR